MLGRTFFVCSLLLVCTASHVDAAAKPRQVTATQIERMSKDHGVLFGTYTRASPSVRFGSESVFFRQAGSRKTHRIGVGTLPFGRLTFDFEEPREVGSLFSFVLPAGDYEIVHFEATQESLAGPITHAPLRPISVPFRIEAGKANYLGSIQIVRSSGTFRIATSGGVSFWMSHRLERDTRLFTEIVAGHQLETVDAYPAPTPRGGGFTVRAKRTPTESSDSPESQEPSSEHEAVLEPETESETDAADARRAPPYPLLTDTLHRRSETSAPFASSS
ncbi:hypothetical protein ASA1KI_33580 [Opitutales bacterium ASA1]|uniref:hypothetical protein n=1 Tax=Congregicoccus parvus TaxID=3081749 RepID=UPI002B2A844C|nr:hypothetical protein ASA1KI_33580 [Opitutales bacterium ASA1]